MSSYGDKDTIILKAGYTYDSLGLESQDDYDALIAALNEEASGMVNRYCHRDFEEHDELMTLDGSGNAGLQLRGYPVINIDSVKVDSTALIEGTDFRIRKDSMLDGNSGILDRKYSVWPCGWDNIEVDFQWGFVTPPAEVRGGIENMIVALLTRTANLAQGQGLTSYSMDGFSVSFKTELGKVVWGEQKATFNRFKRIIGG